MAEKKCFTVLENHPEVMNALATELGLSQDLQFYDVYSLDEPELLAHIPRPVHALLVIIPLTDAWDRDRRAEDSTMADYCGSGDQEPVIWFKQTIGHACGSIGLLHCSINGPASQFIIPGSTLEKLRAEAIPLKMAGRAQMLYDSQAFEDAHRSVATLGDTAPLTIEQGHKLGQHFVAFVKADDGHLWELEGSRKGPLDRGLLGDDEDVLSPRALELGLKRVMNIEKTGGGSDLRFSCIALAARTH
ncbi:ubiquitin carboxyl-terminal hydrolase [Coniochaeta ligniaria NRRL 30616]|uniref:Ubiquitin carboxyl-terminal hydrolase n=1 Tax=Coniochaeta ligniaria NRRL 30616 TaxID=1408157 RepID=A0A1J7K528_9PEZI|nr:ubiquitin carboxyl-terminal hydrolase [Coniochaeta ligniaria NRRL 30616]